MTNRRPKKHKSNESINQSKYTLHKEPLQPCIPEPEKKLKKPKSTLKIKQIYYYTNQIQKSASHY